MTRNTNRRTFLRRATSGLALASVPSLALASNKPGDENVENHPGRSWTDRFEVKIDPRNDIVLVTVIDRWKDESHHYITKVTANSIRRKEVEAVNHQALVHSVDNEGGIEPAKVHLPGMPDCVERWHSFSKEISNHCGSIGYSEHYMVGLTFETNGPVSEIGAAAIGGMIGGALGSVIGPEGSWAGGAIGGGIGGLVGSIVAMGYDTPYLTVAWVDRDKGPSLGTVPYLNRQYSGKWDDQRPNKMYSIGAKPGVHGSPIQEKF